jgi:hypothetical protein
MGNSLDEDHKKKLMELHDKAFHEALKQAFHNFIMQKTGSPKTTLASHYQTNLKIIFDCYETSRDALKEFLDSYK